MKGQIAGGQLRAQLAPLNDSKEWDRLPFTYTLPIEG